MPEKLESLITLEMLGLEAAKKPMKLQDENSEFLYAGYRGIGFNAACGLHYFANANTRVFIATELPENPGTSITNRAEMVAQTIEESYGEARQVFQKGWKYLGEGKAITYVYIEHYPRSKRRGDFDENFSVVFFDVNEFRIAPPNTAAYYENPNWIPVSRKQVERLIGQEFEGYEFE